MKQLMKWQPLIIEPVLALTWIVGWLNLMTIYQIVKGPVHVGSQRVESVLIFSGVILIADVYNLILTYQQNPAIVRTSLYRGLSIFQALIIICLLVLSWSHPSVVLLPTTVTVWNLIFILLAGTKGLVGNFFAVTSRYIPFPPKQEFGSGQLTFFVRDYYVIHY